MKEENKKRAIWFTVFMLWIGMVSAIMVYQESNNGGIAKPDAGVLATTTLPTTTQVQTNVEQVSGQNTQNVQSTRVEEEVSDQEFFVKYRLERDKSRSEQINIYRDTINNPNTDAASKKIAQEGLLNLTTVKEQEMQIESLIRARGYGDAIAFLHENGIEIIVHTQSGLTEKDAAKIGDIVNRITQIRAENMNIIDRGLDRDPQS